MSPEASALWKRSLLALALCVGVYFGIMALLQIPGFKVAKSVQDDVTTYRWSIWMSWAPLLIALVLFLLAWRVRNWPAAWRCLLVVGLMALVSGMTFAAVNLFDPRRPQVAVGADHFEIQQRIVLYGGLQELRHNTTWSVGFRRGWPYPSQAIQMTLVWNNGQSERVNVGGLLEDALPEIVSRAKAKGVRVTEEE